MSDMNLRLQSSKLLSQLYLQDEIFSVVLRQELVKLLLLLFPFFSYFLLLVILTIGRIQVPEILDPSQVQDDESLKPKTERDSVKEKSKH
jgi:hypothetical protein